MAFFFSCSWFAKGVSIELKNLQSNAITHIVVSYKDGNKSIAHLGAGETNTFIVNPKSESNLVLKYIDNSGKQIEKAIDVYIEKNYSGKVIVHIKEGNDIQVEDHINL